MKKLCSLFMTAFTAIALTVPAFAASQTDPTGSWGMWFKYMLAAAVFGLFAVIFLRGKKKKQAREEKAENTAIKTGKQNKKKK